MCRIKPHGSEVFRGEIDLTEPQARTIVENVSNPDRATFDLCGTRLPADWIGVQQGPDRLEFRRQFRKTAHARVIA